MSICNVHGYGTADSVTEIDAQQVLGYVVYKDGKHTRASYPLKDFHSDVAGKSFHHGVSFRGCERKLPFFLSIFPSYQRMNFSLVKI